MRLDHPTTPVPRLLAWMGVGALLALAAFPPLLEAKVFTTRPQEAATLDNPSSFGARQIYAGRFRINGRLADMRILSGSASATDTLRALTGGGGSGVNSIRFRVAGDTAIGSVGKDSEEKRFLISSLGGGRSCLVFVLRGDAGVFSRDPALIPWPPSLPQLDSTQLPQLVVEHLDTGFVFASVIVPGARWEDVLRRSREQLGEAGWQVEPLTEKAVADMADSGVAVLSKKGKTCWVEARQGPTPSQSLVTLLCKTP